MNTLTTWLRLTFCLLLTMTLLIPCFAMAEPLGQRFEFISALAAPIQGGEFWQKKDYHRWSESECRKLLEESPWALKYQVRGHEVPHGDITKTPGETTSLSQMFQAVDYEVQFRSALPIRQAEVRIKQHQQKYDKMTPEQKKVFDDQTNKLLEENFQDKIVIYLRYSSTLSSTDKDLYAYWKDQVTTASLKNSVYLINQRGEKIQLTACALIARTAHGHGIELDFPREQNGKPIIADSDKNLKLQFVNPPTGGRPWTPVILDFNPSKMTVGGSLVY